MSLSDQLTALAKDGTIVGVLLAFVAVKAWQGYNFTSSALHKIHDAPNIKISDLRQLLEKEAETHHNGSKLVMVKGIVEAQRSVDGLRSTTRPNALVSNETGESAVLIEKTLTCVYDRWWGLFRWTPDYLRTWKDQQSRSVRMVPFVLMDTGRSSSSDYLFVNMDGSKHHLPLSTVYTKLQPYQASPYTFLQAVFGHPHPVGLLDEEKVISLGKQISAVGVCSFEDGVPQIKSSQALPYFLTDMTKDQLMVDLAFKKSCLFWGGLLLGSLSIGILGYATMRNLRRWKEWRQRRQIEQSREANCATSAGAMDTELETDKVAVEVLPDGELCVVCLMQRRRAAFVPCGHMVCCPRCALAVRRHSSPTCLVYVNFSYFVNPVIYHPLDG
ncbi:hypothetical protein MKW94_023464 [Papaver nudicaule]|uniref:RING-type E3 ubiquitin transferase n=1 Tax=Papaver nudicaule TaxID=74823 RepID=A0AA41VEH9_PAPNU|nr:hypothetical protein [Papaver nudicaule]